MGNRFPALCASLLLVAACGEPTPPTPTSTPPPTSTPTTAPTFSEPPATPTVVPATATPEMTASPEATATTTAATPSPTPAVLPTDSLLPSTGLVVDAADIGRHLDALAQIAQQNNGNRTDGTPGYTASADYVADVLTGLGFHVTRQPVTYTFFAEAAPVTLSVGDQSWSGTLWMHAMVYSPPGSVDAPVRAVGILNAKPTATAGCDVADWAGFPRGDIALVMSGMCAKRDQLTFAQQAGAVGLIALYTTWGPGQTRQPTLLEPTGVTIPAIAVGQEPTAALLAASVAGHSATFHVEVNSSQQTTENVIGDLPGSSDDVILVGAHLDSVPDGPGINDNASGVAAVLDIARGAVAQGTPRATVRVAFWAAEEYGDLGSAAYVKSLSADEQQRIKAYLDLDMVGSPNPARFVYADAAAPAGSAEITQRLLDALAAQGKPGLTLDAAASSDNYEFELVGIPSGGVFSGLGPVTPADAAVFGNAPAVPTDPCYHLACDDRNNISMASELTLGQAIATVVKELAY